jgi:hypothetical protein
MPAAPSNESTEIQCPAGSHRLGRWVGMSCYSASVVAYSTQ